MLWLHLGIWPDNLGIFYIFLVCACRSVLVHLCPISSFHLCYLPVGTGPASWIVPVSQSPRCRQLFLWVLFMEEMLWKSLSNREPLLLSSALTRRLARVISSSFPIFLFYVRGIHHSSPCAVTQGEMKQLSLFSGFPVPSGINDHTNTSLSLWRWLGHLVLLLAAPHKPSWLLVTEAQSCQEPSKRTVCFKYQTHLKSLSKILEDFAVEDGGAFTGLENEAVPWPDHFLVLVLPRCCLLLQCAILQVTQY